VKVVLGVAGGIAAYKAASLLRLFTEAGHDVTVVPTQAALNFVGAATWSALSGKPVHTDVWSDITAVPHVRIGQEADLVVVAPATADLLARAATADPAALQVEALRDAGAAARARALRHWIEGLSLPPLPAEGVARIDAHLLDARADAQAEFAWHGAVVRRWRGLLHAERQRPALPDDWQVDWDGAAPLVLPDGGVVSLEDQGAPFDVPLRLTARRGGERIALPGRAHRHALKDVLQSLGIPPWERRQLPLLWRDDVLWAAGDLVLSAECDVWLRTAGRRLAWRRG